MKKIVLSLVLVLVVVVQINANTNIKKNQINNEEIELPSCLIDAYNATNNLEAQSEEGPYGWDINEWTTIFNYLFEKCEQGKDVIALTEDN